MFVFLHPYPSGEQGAEYKCFFEKALYRIRRLPPYLGAALTLTSQETGAVASFTTGAQASMSSVTSRRARSGTDKFHGSACEFLRNTDLNARQFGLAERPKHIENEFGFRIGGPTKSRFFSTKGDPPALPGRQ